MDEPSALQKFEELLGSCAADAALADLLPGLRSAGNLAAALRLLRRKAPEKRQLIAQFSTALESERRTRQAGWQHDTERTRLRLVHRRTGPAAALNPGAFLAAVAGACASAGWALADSLEKRPRPLVLPGHPLPLGTEGLEEVLEVVLNGAPRGADPLADLNRHAVPGLVFLSISPQPDHASPLLDLCAGALWRWPCPAALRPEAEARVSAFLAASEFQIEKTGKAEGRKQVKRMEVRPLVRSMVWEGGDLAFELRLDPGQALHPARLLGGVLGLDAAEVQGLVRERVLLREDPRLSQAERFQPKLKNMFEDAVLLKAGPSLQVFDDDEGEPIRLG